MMIYKNLNIYYRLRESMNTIEYTIKSDSSSISTGMDKHII